MVPKPRTCRNTFLKRTQPPLILLEQSCPLRLPEDVGRRVACATVSRYRAGWTQGGSGAGTDRYGPVLLLPTHLGMLLISCRTDLDAWRSGHRAHTVMTAKDGEGQTLECFRKTEAPTGLLNIPRHCYETLNREPLWSHTALEHLRQRLTKSTGSPTAKQRISGLCLAIPRAGYFRTIQVSKC